MASMDKNARTPWAKIAEDPTKFFDADTYPYGFKFEDPSRMGKSVMDLLNHLRERQTTYGVNAFHFKRYFKNKLFYTAQYPEPAKKAIEAGIDVKTWIAPAGDDNSPITKSDLAEIPCLDISDTVSSPTKTHVMGADPSKVMSIGESSSLNTVPIPDGIRNPFVTHPGNINGPSYWVSPMTHPFNFQMYHPNNDMDKNIDPRLRFPGMIYHNQNVPDGDPFPNVTKERKESKGKHVVESGKHSLVSTQSGTSGATEGLAGIQYPTLFPPSGMPSQGFSIPAIHPTYGAPGIYFPTSTAGPSNKLLPTSMANTLPPSGMVIPANTLSASSEMTKATSAIKIQHPIFSPSSTPSRTPRKRKRGQEADIPNTPSTSTRPKRNIVPNKKYSEYTINT